MRRWHWRAECPIRLVWLSPQMLSAFCVNISETQAQVKRTYGRSHCAVGRTRVEVLVGTTNLNSWAIAEEGNEEAITRMREGLAAFRGTGADLDLPYWFCLLAEVHG